MGAGPVDDLHSITIIHPLHRIRVLYYIFCAWQESTWVDDTIYQKEKEEYGKLDRGVSGLREYESPLE